MDNSKMGGLRYDYLKNKAQWQMAKRHSVKWHNRTNAVTIFTVKASNMLKKINLIINLHIAKQTHRGEGALIVLSEGMHI